MLKVRFYSEGGRERGYGHLARCGALLKEFRRAGHDASLFVRGDETVSAILEPGSYALRDWLSEAPQPCDIAVIDSYSASVRDCERLSAQSSAALYFDDNNRIPYPPGAVLNGTLAAEKIDYPRSAGTAYLLGPRYQLVRPELFGAKKMAWPETPESAAVMFGGNDIRNMTPAVLKLLAEKFPRLRKNVILGKSCACRADVRNFADERTLIHESPPADEMAGIIRDSDFAVCAGGQTLFELAAIGTPAAVINIADNQRENIAGWLEAGFIVFAGNHDDIGLAAGLLRAINELSAPGKIAEMGARGPALLNPSAAREIAEFMIKRVALGAVRLADGALSAENFAVLSEKEKKLVYEWRTSPQIAKWMRTGDFSLEKHLEFVAKLPKRSDCYYWLFKSGGVPLGVGDLTDIKDGRAELGIYSAPGVRGAGESLMSGIFNIGFGLLGLDEIRAEVYEDNAAARRLYERCGMTLVPGAKAHCSGCDRTAALVYVMRNPHKAGK